jgi:disease resistance protein RPM1
VSIVFPVATNLLLPLSSFHLLRVLDFEGCHDLDFIVFPGATNLLPPLSSFHLLRLLDFEGCHDLDCNQIDGLVNLFHLRCLVLKDTNIANLPKTNWETWLFAETGLKEH